VVKCLENADGGGPVFFEVDSGVTAESDQLPEFENLVVFLRDLCGCAVSGLSVAVVVQMPVEE